MLIEVYAPAPTTSFDGWMNRHQQAVIDCLLEENRILRAKLGKSRLLFTDPERRRLRARAGRSVARSSRRSRRRHARHDPRLAPEARCRQVELAGKENRRPGRMSRRSSSGSRRRTQTGATTRSRARSPREASGNGATSCARSPRRSPSTPRRARQRSPGTRCRASTAATVGHRAECPLPVRWRGTIEPTTYRLSVRPFARASRSTCSR